MPIIRGRGFHSYRDYKKFFCLEACHTCNVLFDFGVSISSREPSRQRQRMSLSPAVSGRPTGRRLASTTAIVISGVRAEVVRQVAPWRPRSQNPEDAIEDTTVIHASHAA